MPSNIANNANGKITLAVVVVRIEELTKQIERLANRVDEHAKWDEERVHCVEAEQHNLETEQARQDERIDHIETSVKSWNIINSVGAVIAVVLAAIGIGKQP